MLSSSKVSQIEFVFPLDTVVSRDRRPPGAQIFASVRFAPRLLGTRKREPSVPRPTFHHSVERSTAPCSLFIWNTGKSVYYTPPHKFRSVAKATGTREVVCLLHANNVVKRCNRRHVCSPNEMSRRK